MHTRLWMGGEFGGGWTHICVRLSPFSAYLKSSHGEGNGTPLQYSCLENPMDGGAWWAAVHWVTKSWTQLSDFTFTFQFHALEREMATHSSVLAWRIPGTAEPGGLPSMGSHRVGQDWIITTLLISYTPTQNKKLQNIYKVYKAQTYQLISCLFSLSPLWALAFTIPSTRKLFQALCMVDSFSFSRGSYYKCYTFRKVSSPISSKAAPSLNICYSEISRL